MVPEEPAAAPEEIPAQQVVVAEEGPDDLPAAGHNPALHDAPAEPVALAVEAEPAPAPAAYEDPGAVPWEEDEAAWQDVSHIADDHELALRMAEEEEPIPVSNP